jgi:hypothetical protein
MDKDRRRYVDTFRKTFVRDINNCRKPVQMFFRFNCITYCIDITVTSYDEKFYTFTTVLPRDFENNTEEIKLFELTKRKNLPNKFDEGTLELLFDALIAASFSKIKCKEKILKGFEEGKCK